MKSFWHFVKIKTWPLIPSGGDEPYDKLKRALRAETREASWSSLYGIKSSPFDPPGIGKIAVKVINHYGDEVLKVFAVQG